jgi:hypothetical protein
VQKQIGQMKSERMKAPKLAVERQADPIQRAIIGSRGGCEIVREPDVGPQIVRDALPGAQGRVIHDLREVIVGREGVEKGSPVEEERPRPTEDEEGASLMQPKPFCCAIGY